MRIEDDHLKADQSSAGTAGSSGSSYFSTVPRMLPMNDCVGPVDGGNDTTATGCPRLVTVTDSPVSCISLIMRRHFALNSAAETRLLLTRSPPVQI